MKRKTALYGLMIALAFILSYLEFLFPLSVGIPGIKLGLANLVVLLCLYRLRTRDALMISLVRILLSGLTFGSITMMLYSLCGGLVSFIAMAVCRYSGRFSVVGVSIAGGVCHNIGQIAAAAVLLSTGEIVWYLPALLIAGLMTGALLGVAARLALPALQRMH
ncbi:MAG: Gx transporter family protein [Ruminococcaceae bacterium]|nr:Gx transporter family protein [Oscillospiraceae bacterium]